MGFRAFFLNIQMMYQLPRSPSSLQSSREAIIVLFSTFKMKMTYAKREHDFPTKGPVALAE